MSEDSRVIVGGGESLVHTRWSGVITYRRTKEGKLFLKGVKSERNYIQFITTDKTKVRKGGGKVSVLCKTKN